MVVRDGVGEVISGFHKNGVLDWVARGNGDGSGSWGLQGGEGRAAGTSKAWLALLVVFIAKFTGLESTNQCRKECGKECSVI